MIGGTLFCLLFFLSTFFCPLSSSAYYYPSFSVLPFVDFSQQFFDHSADHLVVEEGNSECCESDQRREEESDQRQMIRSDQRQMIRSDQAVENRTLQEMYGAALAEGGRLLVYSGGDSPGQQNFTKQMFERRFPNMTVDFVVDYSIYQGPRVDLQLARAPNDVGPDFVQLQTLQDFPRWKSRGVLQAYKPIDWDKVHEAFRDSDGFFTGITSLTMGVGVNPQLVPDPAQWPSRYSDLLRPNLGNGKIAVTHPNMDDAVLFIFKQVIDKYGWDWLRAFAAQRPLFTCSGASLMTLVQNSTVPVGIGFPAFPSSPNSSLQFVFPSDDDPFLTYAMYGAILKAAKHPEAAKLYLNWQLQEQQNGGPNSFAIWSVRTNVTAKENRRQIWEYPNSSHRAFLAFMEKAEERERFGREIKLFLGENPCDMSPMVTGIRPQ